MAQAHQELGVFLFRGTQEQLQMDFIVQGLIVIPHG